MKRENTSERFDIDYDVEPTLEERAVEIKRRVAPASGSLDGWIVCTTPVYYRAHFIGSKTIPHLKTNCPGCKAGNLGELKAYIFVHHEATSRIVGLDLPLGAIETLKRALKLHGTLKGLPIRVSRSGGGQRGRVQISIGQVIDPHFSMLPVPSLQSWCESLWSDHLRAMVFATEEPNAIITEGEKVRAENPAPNGRPKTRRAALNEQSERNRMRTLDGEPIHAGELLSKYLSAVDGVKVNGHSPDAS